MIYEIKEFDDLGFLFSTFLDIDWNDLQIDHFDKSIPVEIRKLYGIRERYLKLNPGVKLFEKQDELINYENLNLNESIFDFIVENQGNWTLQTEKDKDFPKVFMDEGEIISHSLSDFLITYSLQELTFSLKYVGFGSLDLKKIQEIFSSVQPIWNDKKYVWDDYLYNYYLVAGDCLFMEVEDTTFFATNSADKIQLLEN